jgi:hypothetical protein
LKVSKIITKIWNIAHIKNYIRFSFLKKSTQAKKNLCIPTKKRQLNSETAVIYVGYEMTTRMMCTFFFKLSVQCKLQRR